MTDTQTTQTNWLDEELKSIQKPTADFEKLESLKLEDGKIVTFIVDFSKPFEKWNDSVNKAIKAIIPVTHKGVKKNLWMNIKNPFYGELCQAGKKGQTEFKVSTTGTQKDTRYKLVTED